MDIRLFSMQSLNCRRFGGRCPPYEDLLTMSW